MSLIISKKNISKILTNRKLIKNKEELLEYLYFTRNNFIKFSKNLKKINDKRDKHINPLIWQVGHVLLFYVKHVFINLNINELTNLNKYIDFYDSFKTELKYRDDIKYLITYNSCIEHYKKLIHILIEYVKHNKITNVNSYLILLGILHNEMHNEAVLFTTLNINNTIDIPIKNYGEYDLISEIEFIDYPQGKFYQGSKDSKEYLIFDNEMPRFKTNIDKFSISKYCITEFQFLQFILAGGYEDKRFWSTLGYKWKNESNISMPLYWVKKNNDYFKKLNNKYVSIQTNLPIMHISYYEAAAYCNWKGGRLPTESEYEYIATNMGKSKFPWGDKPINNCLCNINYNNYIAPVNKYELGNNYNGVSQLIGNVWEWCQEPIYPYNGFKIDPVYREMSYPYFGYKRVCKGGAFSVPDFLIHPKYRNAQYPDCRIQFIGFRVCI
jgi:gamma-glutamyl hercynylcysteine S-oxide synthase